MLKRMRRTETRRGKSHKLAQPKRMHSSYQIRWVWGCDDVTCTPNSDEAKRRKNKMRGKHTQKMCSVWIALSLDEQKKKQNAAGYLCTFEILSLTLALANGGAVAADAAYATRILH